MFKPIPLMLVLVCFLSGNGHAANWGDPVENSIQVVSSRVNVDLGSRGTNQPLMMFLVNSNDPAGFHLTFTFANKGKFMCNSREVEITSAILSKVSGTLGSGLADPAAPGFSLTIDPGSGEASWTPVGTPTASTVNYLISISASWSDHSSMLAGFYLETVVPAIVSGP